MNRKQRATLAALFARPARPDLRWTEVEALIVALGGTVSVGAGSRVRASLGGARAVFHRPHPRPTTPKATVEDVRAFLRAAGVEPP
jgi:hypothetical protein